ncbi:unnamed protein product [Paramecium octaurelia]|uniref:Uncharacterized protein n=1 Tax=Paramecium octaurelia TaxID=43137 RepID=A0A8S1T748_PAROT|nr:unnamed protein product [Paramecium octaurelia]
MVKVREKHQYEALQKLEANCGQEVEKINDTQGVNQQNEKLLF